MNVRIEQLTRTYLNSLNLSYYSGLDDGRKEKIIEINRQSEWIIFNAGSLKSERETYVDYNVGDYTLEAEEENVLRNGEIVRNPDGTPQKRPTGRRFIRARFRRPDGSISNEDRLNHPGERRQGSFSKEKYDITSPDLKEIVREIIKIYQPASLADTDEINTIVFTGGGGVVNGYKQAAISTSYEGRGDNNYWVAINKKVLSEFYEMLTIASLNDLLNSSDITNSREKTTTSPPTPDNSSTGTSQPRPTPQSVDVSFTIGKATRQWEDMGYFILEPTSAISLRGKKIIRVHVSGNSNDLREGNTISITNIKLEDGRASIDNVIARSNGPTSPSNPQSFPEVSQKNQELAAEENNLALLAAELLEIIDTKNKEVCREAQTIGLNLPAIPDSVLNYFQEEFFQQLDENQPLNSSHNSQINTDNDKIKQKKLNIKNNVYRVYNSNSKKLTDKKHEKNNPDCPPENELAKRKRQIIEEINKIVTDQDNLRNIDLITLANETGAKEKKEEDNNKKLALISPQNQPGKIIIDKNTTKAITSLPLADAKNIAKKKCDSAEKVAAFLEKLQQEIIAQRIQNQETIFNKLVQVEKEVSLRLRKIIEETDYYSKTPNRTGKRKNQEQIFK
ncbi:4981_t:CDS:2 [Entrophospora sp. SA101]|nr:9157_t:CDS:2 [Entrophospora sp. SA101]CAJ0833557.1 4981_t:CDS:2 [Entrophospora sp. SA101]